MRSDLIYIPDSELDALIQQDTPYLDLTTLGLDTTPLALRYLLVGIVCNFISGWATDFTTKIVEKQQGVKLSRKLKGEA